MRLTNGRLYGLFNNGGFGVYGPLNAISRQQMEKQFSTNFLAYISLLWGYCRRCYLMAKDVLFRRVR